MDSETFAQKAGALQTLLQTFDIPDNRMEITPANIRWLSRNLAVRNGDNPMFETARGLIKWLLRNPPQKNNERQGSLNDLGKLYKYEAQQVIKLKQHQIDQINK